MHCAHITTYKLMIYCKTGYKMNILSTQTSTESPSINLIEFEPFANTANTILERNEKCIKYNGLGNQAQYNI